MMSPHLIDEKEAQGILRRLFKGGEIERLPKRPGDARFLLALIASSLQPSQHYSERDLNVHLTEWLAGFTCPIGLDHVTVRRYLVDHGFVLRDAEGSWYTVNTAVVGSVLDASAMEVYPRDIFDEVQLERLARKRAYRT